MKAVVKDYELTVKDVPLPEIPRGWVLVKVVSAAWGGLEEAVALNMVWVEPGRVLGMQGYGTVVQLGVAAPKNLSGKRVVVGRLPAPYGIPGYSRRVWSLVYEVAPLPGTAYDGWLAEYAALPSSALTEVESADPELAALATSAAIAWVAGRELTVAVEGEKIAVVGSGLTAFLASYAAKEMGKEAPVFVDDDRWLHYARELGVEARRVSELASEVEPGRGFDAIFLATIDPYTASYAVEAIGVEGLLLLHPAYAYVKPPSTVKGRVRLLASFPGQTGIQLLRMVRDVVEEATMVVQGLELPSIPRPKPFIIYFIGAP